MIVYITIISGDWSGIRTHAPEESGVFKRMQEWPEGCFDMVEDVEALEIFRQIKAKQMRLKLIETKEPKQRVRDLFIDKIRNGY